SVVITHYTKVDMLDSFNILPAQAVTKPDGSLPPPFTAPDTVVYKNPQAYPGTQVKILDQGILMGYKIVTLLFYPVEFIPVQNKVSLYDTLEFTVYYSSGTNQWTTPHSISPNRKQMVINFVKSVVENIDDVDLVSGGPNGVPVDQGLQDNLLNQQYPVSLGCDPDYLIITVNALRNSFQPLIDWKNKKGIPTVIATLEDDIIGKYPGCDSAEQIRNFILSVTDQTGPGLCILLGGDINLIQCRNIFTTNILTDLYFGTQSNLNSNGNYIFCENSDFGYNLNPIHLTGRIPVRDTSQVKNYCRKVLEYEKLSADDSIAINPAFLKRMMVMVGSSSPGENSWRDTVNNRINNPSIIPSQIEKWRLYDTGGDVNLSKPNALEFLNKPPSEGFGIVYHLDHSGPFTMGTSAMVNHHQLYSNDVLGLANSETNCILLSDGCTINKFSENSISKSFLNNTHGGSVAFFGKSTSSGHMLDQFCKLFRVCYSDTIQTNNHLGFACAAAIISGSSTYNPEYNLLGDPELPIWGYWGSSANPPSLVLTSPPAQVMTGPQTLNLNVGNLFNGTSFRICVSKPDEIYKTFLYQSSGSSKQCQIFINPKSTGSLSVVLTAKNRQNIPFWSCQMTVQNFILPLTL
ncbi:MAG TPA: C25 family cysteine peptidase, partial [Bacteroidales bacterium]|nr:C25 family cysteine peptidase [Bacteroidales bacterium]